MKKDVIEKISTLITAAFGLVAALAWNEAIQSLFRPGGPLYVLAVTGPWVYAVAVTIIAVAVTVWISRLTERKIGMKHRK